MENPAAAANERARRPVARAARHTSSFTPKELHAHLRKSVSVGDLIRTFDLVAVRGSGLDRSSQPERQCRRSTLSTGGCRRDAGRQWRTRLDNYETDYFSIVRYHRGHFVLSGTSSARGAYLNQCRLVGGDQKISVNSKYGGVENGP